MKTMDTGRSFTELVVTTYLSIITIAKSFYDNTQGEFLSLVVYKGRVEFLQICQIVFSVGVIHLTFSSCSSSQRQHEVEKNKRK